MAIPLSYQSNSKNDFIFPRTPPTPCQYGSPILQKLDMVVDRPKAWWAMSDSIRNHIIAVLGEFVGTLSFLFFGFAAVQISKSHLDNLAGGIDVSSPSLLQIFFISAGFGLSLTVNAWIFFRVSGSAFNPAVTFGLCLVGAVPWFRGILVIPVQIGAGIAAAGLVSGLFPGPFDAQNTLGAGTTEIQGIFIEMILTAQIIFTIMMLAVEKHRASFVAPVSIGLALFLGHFIGVNFTGAGLNPARTFGPAVVEGKFFSYQWIYWLGPGLGAIWAVVLYKFLKFLQYETANPGQDDDGLDSYRIVQPQQHSRRRGSMGSFASMAPTLHPLDPHENLQFPIHEFIPR